jgi:hypothetical protein
MGPNDLIRERRERFVELSFPETPQKIFARDFKGKNLARAKKARERYAKPVR